MPPVQTDKTFCEFFAGIGLVGEALRRSGWACVYANDIEPKKRQVFEAHFGSTSHYHLADVWQTADVVSRIGGRPFLATASFPCTDLSLAGHWRGLDGAESSAFFGFTRVLDSLADRRPPLVMLENVPGLLTASNGRDFPTAVGVLADLGYWVDAFILDARAFVPQSRPRLFIIGAAGQLDLPGMVRQRPGLFGSAAWEHAVAAAPGVRPPSLVQAMRSTELATGWFTTPLTAPPVGAHRLVDVIDLDAGQDWWDETRVADHRAMMHGYHRTTVDAHVAAGHTWVGTIYRRTRRGEVRAEVRFDGVAGCLRTTKGGSARQIVCAAIDGRLRMRWMSPREYARLQGAGDFVLDGSTDHQAMFGFGDAVCVPVVQWIDEQVLTPFHNAAAAAVSV